MRTRLLPVFLGTAIAALSAALVTGGCFNAPYEVVWFDCKPDAAHQTDPECLPDAGPDGSSEGGAGGPGVEPQGCAARCVPAPSGNEAGFWTDVPGLVWVGPASELPKNCPEEVPIEKHRRFADLVAPPLVCGICDCEPSEGTCTGVPEEIRIQAGTCGAGAPMVPFDGSAGWDGSCTAENAMAAGEKCPAGSSTFCAQSVWFSPLPSPLEEACKATLKPTPTFGEGVSWATGVLACRATTETSTCGDPGKLCVRDLPLPWRQCVWRAGEHGQCPANYPDGPMVTYGEKSFTDGRECTACECGAPVGSACVGTAHLYADGACGAQFWEGQVYSGGDQCTNVWPPGGAVGSKAITDVTYVGGTCVASGGEAIGEAHGNATDALTFCCYPPFN